jgi:uncharacterized protein YggT (Ycf19 family)
MTMIILLVLEKLIYIYIFIVCMRIVFSWFKPVIDGKSSKNVSKLWHYLCLITGPYLALFKGLKRFRTNAFDFTPAIAVLVLLAASQVIGLFTVAERITFGVIIIILVLGVWEAIRLLLIFFFALCVVRFIGIFFHDGLMGKFLDVVDLALQPFTSFILRITNKKLSYQTILVLCLGVIAVVCIAGSLSFAPLYGFLTKI